MLPEAHIAHSLARRARIRIPEKKGSASYFSAVYEQLSKCPGVEAVKVNPATGSVLVLHDCDSRALAKYARDKELFSLGERPHSRRTLFQQVAEVFQKYNRDLMTMTSGEIDIPSAVFVTLVISGLWQLFRGNVMMPAWYTAFYYALGVFSHAKVDEYDEGAELFAEAGEVESE